QDPLRLGAAGVVVETGALLLGDLGGHLFVVPSGVALRQDHVQREGHALEELLGDELLVDEDRERVTERGIAHRSPGVVEGEEPVRSEERRVGKESGYQRGAYR